MQAANYRVIVPGPGGSIAIVAGKALSAALNAGSLLLDSLGTGPTSSRPFDTYQQGGTYFDTTINKQIIFHQALSAWYATDGSGQV